jgi:tubulin polyglutamylase TTLL5
MLVWQRWNHFAGIKALTRKDLLCRHLGAARSAYGAAFDIMPQTFSLPGDYVAFVDAFTRAAADANSPPPLWIMKPIGSSRGRGIFLVRSLEDVAYGEPHVVQRYLERPLTVDGHKFDLRLFVLVTSFAPTEAFIYTDGFARFSTERYTTTDIANLRVHLTNYAVQNASGTVPAPLRGLHSGAAGGSKCSLTHLWSMLAAGRAAFDAALLWPRICDLVRRALFCVRGAIGHQPNAFELLGFDVMLDDEARPWLLEVNSSPSLECDYPIDERLKTQLLADVMAIVAPPAFDRAALAAALRQRSAGGGLRTRDGLNADLNAILGGQLPRRFGDMPQQLGLFQRIAPSVEWDALMKRTKKAGAPERAGLCDSDAVSARI